MRTLTLVLGVLLVVPALLLADDPADPPVSDPCAERCKAEADAYLADCLANGGGEACYEEARKRERECRATNCGGDGEEPGGGEDPGSGGDPGEGEDPGSGDNPDPCVAGCKAEADADLADCLANGGGEGCHLQARALLDECVRQSCWTCEERCRANAAEEARRSGAQTEREWCDAYQAALAACEEACSTPLGKFELVSFIRGDVNRDDAIDLADPVAILAYLFADEALASCADAADANDDGIVNIADPIAELMHIFGGLSDMHLPAPYPLAGDDPTADGMFCLK
ncbi:MAG: hypothetical protein JXP34_09795 [Planctomycetes bacterium]|nr:hypothetical protein [Planctomycetota bacterium]